MQASDRKFLFILFLLLSGYYGIAFTHQLSASDTIFYLMTAREFSEGLLMEGVNSYWGILISILMVPLMWIGIKGVWAFKAIQVLIGLYGVHQVWKLGEVFGLRGITAFWTMLFGVSLIWMMSLSHTPDLLMAVLLIAYFIETSRPEGFSGWKIGLIGGLLFLCKGYGFPFFAAHFTIWFLLKKFRQKYKKETTQSARLNKTFLTGIAAFGLIAGSWTAILSVKYGHLSLGSSGSYNMAYMGPKMQFTPPYFDRLQNPDTEFTTYFIGEEQGLFADYGKWNPIDSKAEFNYFLNRIPFNLSKLYYITYLRDIVALLLISFILIRLFKIRFSTGEKQLFLSVLLFLGIYNSGYFVLFPNERYLWINHILLTLLFFKLIGNLKLGKRSVFIGNVLLITSIFIFGINIQDRVAFRTQEHRFHRALHNIKPDLAKLSLKDKNVVSNIRPKPAEIPDYMDPVCLLMYENRFRLWGFISSKKLSSSIPGELSEMGIDYFFLWRKDQNTTMFADYPVLYSDEKTGLKIFDLRTVH